MLTKELSPECLLTRSLLQLLQLWSPDLTPAMRTVSGYVVNEARQHRLNSFARSTSPTCALPASPATVLLALSVACSAHIVLQSSW